MNTTRILVRGIDAIHAAVERASKTRAAFSLMAALAALNRLVEETPKG